MPALEQVPQISTKLDEIDGLLNQLANIPKQASATPPSPPDQLKPLVEKLQKIYDTYYNGTNIQYSNSITLQESIANLLNSIVYVLVNHNRLDKATIPELRGVALAKAKAVDEYTLRFISDTLEGILKLLDSTLENEAEFLYYAAKSQLIFDAIEYLKEDNRREISKTANDRSNTLKDLRDSKFGLECKAENKVCKEKDSPENIPSLLSHLFDLSCKLDQQSSSIFSPDLKFIQECKTENIHASLCDVYNCLFIEGLKKSGEQKIAPLQTMLCQHLYEAMTQAMKLIGNKKMTLLSMIQKLQSFRTVSNSVFFDTTPGTPVSSVYGNFFKFLIRRHPNSGESVSDRYATFQLLQEQCADRQDLFVDMFAVSLVFLMLNFCEGNDRGWFSGATGTGSLENIIKTLKTDYRPRAKTDEEEEEPSEQPWES